MTCCSEQPLHCRVWPGSRSVCPAMGQLASAGEPSSSVHDGLYTHWNPSPKSPTQSTAVISYGNYMKIYEIIASQTSLSSICSQTSTFPTVKMLLSYVMRQIWTTHNIYISLLMTKKKNKKKTHNNPPPPQKKMKRLCFIGSGPEWSAATPCWKIVLRLFRCFTHTQGDCLTMSNK